jgi:nitroreductase
MSLSEPEFQAWNVSERQFPKDGTKTEQLKFILNYAILSPSSHNTQPWLFKIVGVGVARIVEYTKSNLNHYSNKHL